MEGLEARIHLDLDRNRITCASTNIALFVKTSQDTVSQLQFDSVKQDVVSVKQDVVSVKQDVVSVKKDLSDLRVEVQDLTQLFRRLLDKFDDLEQGTHIHCCNNLDQQNQAFDFC